MAFLVAFALYSEESEDFISEFNPLYYSFIFIMNTLIDIINHELTYNN